VKGLSFRSALVLSSRSALIRDLVLTLSEERPRCRIGVRHDGKGLSSRSALVLSSRSDPIRDLVLPAFSKDGSLPQKVVELFEFSFEVFFLFEQRKYLLFR